MKKLSLLLFSLCIIAIITGCGGNTGANKIEKTAITYMEIKSDDMLNDYILDIGTAQNRYKDKNVKITGKFLKKCQFHNSNQFYAVIGYKVAAGRTYTILVEYPTDRVEELNKLKFDDFVVVSGHCVGLVKQENPTEINVQIKLGKTVNDKEAPVSSTDTAAPTTNAETSKISTSTTSKPATEDELSIYSPSATGLFKYFHQQITEHNLREAYNCFTPDYKNQIDYSGWAPGYDTTLKSIPIEISTISNSGSKAVLNYRLKAIDRAGDSTIENYFKGQVILYKIDGRWKIDEITAQKD